MPVFHKISYLFIKLSPFYKKPTAAYELIIKKQVLHRDNDDWSDLSHKAKKIILCLGQRS